MENWKRIDDYPSYMVSDLGRVKNLDYMVKGKEKILKLWKTEEGYLRVNLRKDGKQKKFSVHRLVAEAFIENVENKPLIDHINTIRDDNRVENLRWVTSRENNLNPITRKRYTAGNLKSRVQFKKAVCQYSMDDVFIKEWPSATEVEKAIGINRGNISTCCHEGKGSAGGYKWKYSA